MINRGGRATTTGSLGVPGGARPVRRRGRESQRARSGGNDRRERMCERPERSLARLLSSKDHKWLKDDRGRLVDTVLKRSRDGEGSPFGVELELVADEAGLGGSEASASSERSRVRVEVDCYHVYYILSGSGRLGHLSFGTESTKVSDVVELESGDIFAIAPRVPYAIETRGGESRGGGGKEGMVMLSISVPVSLAAHKGVIAAQGAGGGSKTWSMDHRRSSSPVDRRNSMDVPAQIKLKQQETESCLLSSRLRRTAELLTFQLPSMNNRIAPVFDPFRDCTPFTCSIEILDPQGVIPRHLHDEAYELFIVLSGRADLYLNQSDEPVTGAEGDTLLVKPKNVHSIVNPDAAEKLYMLSIILPNETFAKQVWNGSYSGKLGTADVSHLID